MEKRKSWVDEELAFVGNKKKGKKKELAFPLLKHVARMAPESHHQLMQHLQESREEGAVTEALGNTGNKSSVTTS